MLWVCKSHFDMTMRRVGLGNRVRLRKWVGPGKRVSLRHSNNRIGYGFWRSRCRVGYSCKL